MARLLLFEARGVGMTKRVEEVSRNRGVMGATGSWRCKRGALRTVKAHRGARWWPWSAAIGDVRE